MRTNIMRYGFAGLLFQGIFVFCWAPAQAMPVNPERCKGPIPIGVDKCEATQGNFVFCTADGEFMCCHPNELGGKDCELIESMGVHPQGGLRIPGGNLQVAPMNPPPSTSRFPTTGINAPIMRRGVEGEQPAEPAPETSVPPEQPTGTKPQ
jgi:hypothetical protein